jgi:hypothetical protein
MSELTLSEHLTTAFYYWEHKARGWYFFDIPVQLEPPFQSFSYANHLDFQAEDTGKVRSLPNMVLDGVKGLFKSNKPTAYQPSLEEYYSYEANPYTPSQKIFEIRVVLPEQKDIPAEIMHQLLLMLSTTREPLSFEIIGTEDEITLQIVCREFDYQVVYGNFKTFLPSAIISPTEKPFHTLFKNDLVTGIVDSGLSEEFMRPIKMDHKLNPDPLTGIYASLEHLGHEELGIVQILFQGTKSPWSKSIMSSVTDFDGKPFFKDAPETTKLAQLKVANPLFGVVIRVAAQAHSEYRVETIIYGLLGSLRSLNNPNSNELIPLSNEGLPLHFHVQDLLLRQSHRMGMILNSKELLGLVHLPASHIQSRKLRGAIKKTKALHPQHNGYEYVLGVNSHFGQSQSISLTTEERLRHVHLIGATGSGKSNLMKNLIVQDIQNGQGICVLDPHGDLVEDVLVRVPEERIKDLILIDPSDMEYPIGLNLLSAKSEIEKIVLESDLVSVFRRQSTSWGDQMTSVLSNAINAFLESNKGGSLLDLRTFLVDKNFRNEFLKTVEDESVIQFWQKEFPLLRSNSIASILTRLDTFLRPKVIRHMMMQTKGLDFDEAMNSGKILLIKLSQGLIGEANSHLLGTLFIAKLNQASLSRQQIEASKRKPFYLYIDEFQNFITDSLTSILSGARKYGLGLVLAHQDMEQVMAKDREVANSVLSNPYTRICFRCGDNDARKLEQSFSFFEAADIQNLQVGEAIVRIGQRDNDGNIATELLSPVDELMALHTKGIIVESSRAKYAEHISNLKKKKANLAQEEELEEPIEEEIEEKPVDETIKTEHTLKPTESKPIEQTTTHLELAKDKFIKNFEEQKEQRQHQLLQTFVKKIAEERGFKATVEEPTPDGRRVDVGLSANNLKIACEISVTNTVDYEVQNIQKCFNADYKHVFMISDNPKHLRMIREAAIQSIDKEFLSNLIFITSQNLIDEIDRIIAQSEKKPQITQKIAGYRIHVKTNPKGDILKVKDSIKDTIRKSLQNRKDGDE